MNRSKVFLGAGRYLFVGFASVIALVPVVWMATMAFKPREEWTSGIDQLSWLPKNPTLDNFTFIFTGHAPKLLVAIDRVAVGPAISSLVCATLGTIIAVVVGTLAAYGVSRFKFGQNLPLSILQLRLFPPLAVMIPVMIMWAYLNLIDTWWGLSLIYGIVTLPFSFWLMMTFFDDVPREIEEAALVEGCTPWIVFLRVTLPMVKAPLATTILFVFILNWSDYAIALLLTRKDWITIPVFMNALSTAMTGQMYGAKAALGLIAAISARGARHPHPEVSCERTDFWSPQAMNVAITEHQGEALPVARPMNNLAAQSRRLGTLMILPAQLLLLFIVVFPLLMQIYISLTYWGPTDGVSWIYAYQSLNLFDNYVTFFTDGDLWAAIARTLFIMFVAVPLEFLLGLGLATLFVDSFPGRRIFYSILLTPMMVVPAVAGYMFYMLFQSNGPVNQILSFLSNSNVELVWLSVPHLALVAVIAADVWQWTPLVFLILLAGILAVPEDQLKAAMMLGASWPQRFRRIILPRMRTVIIIVLVLRLVEAFKLFDVMFVMTRGGPGTATETISLYIYKQTFNGLEWSYVAAIGLTLLVILSLLAVAGMRFMKHEIEIEKAMEPKSVEGKTT